MTAYLTQSKETELMNKTIIEDLDKKIKAVLSTPKATVNIQTKDTSRGIQNQIALKDLWKQEKFQSYADIGLDVYSHQEARPTAGELANHQRQIMKLPVIEDKYKRFVPPTYSNDPESILARAFEFDPSVLMKLQKECGITEQETAGEKEALSTANSEESAEGLNPPVPEIPPPTTAKRVISLGMDLLKKFAPENFKPSNLGDKGLQKPPTSPLKGHVAKGEIVADSSDVWDREVFSKLEQGTSVHELSHWIAKQVRSGIDIPPDKRGLLWRKLLGNQMKINRKLFTSLVTRLDRVPIGTRESIYKDIERTYSEFKGSETYQLLKKDVFLVLELFDIKTYYQVFNHLIKRHFPEKFEVIMQNDIHPSIFMVEWFYTFFARQFRLPQLFRLWDLIMLKGEIMLFRLVLLILNKTEFKDRDINDILRELKNLDSLLGEDFYKRLDSKALQRETYYELLSQFRVR